MTAASRFPLLARIPAGDLVAEYPDLLADVREVWVGEGWRPIIVAALDRLQGHPVAVSVVREHCAGLQVSIGPRASWTADAFALAGDVGDEARERSRATCEACGEPGRPRFPGPGVRCDAHAAWR